MSGYARRFLGLVLAATLAFAAIGCGEGALPEPLENPLDAIESPTPAEPSEHPEATEAAPEDGFPQRPIIRLDLLKAPDRAEFVFDEDVPAKTRALVEHAAAQAMEYFEKTSRYRIARVRIVASEDTDFLVDEQLKLQGLAGGRRSILEAAWTVAQGMAWDRYIFVRLSPTGEEFEDYFDEDYGDYFLEGDGLQHVVTHEMAHVLQFQLLGGGEAWSRGRFQVPQWFIEGQAELEATTMLEAYGGMQFSFQRDLAAERARSIEAPLNRLGFFAGLPVRAEAPYTLGLLATDWLAGDQPSGRIFEIWESMGRGESFEDAFRAFNGGGPTVFAAQFEQYRKANFPIYAGGIVGKVTVDGDEPDDLVSVTVCAARWECHEASVNADGHFSVALPDGRYTVSVSTGGRLFSPGAPVYVAGGSTVEDEDEADVFPIFGTWRHLDIDIED